jgi:hypothetical protein
VIHCLGLMTPEKVTVLGTVSIIFSNIGKQATSKAAWEQAIALIVLLLSDSKISLSDAKLTFDVVTNGPPVLPIPERYLETPILSNMYGVSSNESSPLVPTVLWPAAF